MLVRGTSAEGPLAACLKESMTLSEWPGMHS